MNCSDLTFRFVNSRNGGMEKKVSERGSRMKLIGAGVYNGCMDGDFEWWRDVQEQDGCFNWWCDALNHIEIHIH